STASSSGELADLRRLIWKESVTSAVLCQHLAVRRSLHPEEAFLAGLLHDFSKIIVLGALETLVQPTDARAAGSWLEMIDRMHVEVGVMIASRWRLSDAL